MPNVLIVTISKIIRFNITQIGIPNKNNIFDPKTVTMNASAINLFVEYSSVHTVKFKLLLTLETEGTNLRVSSQKRNLDHNNCRPILISHVDNPYYVYNF